MPGPLRKAILERHRKSLQGRLRGSFLRSSFLGIDKPFYVYEPPGFKKTQQVPLLYLFRGHEREWVNFREDTSRKATTAIEDLDRMIVMGVLPPVIAVIPGLNSSNNYIPSLGINMLQPDVPHAKGLGNGRVWDFMVEELFPQMAADYPQTEGGLKLAAGFSLGGYTISLLAMCLPQHFDHMGVFDGLFMWPQHEDPRLKPVKPFNDQVWLKNGLFDGAFGNPRSKKALSDWNPTDILTNASDELKHQLQETTWWVACASGDGNQGNRDRALFFTKLLRKQGIPVGFDSVFFHDDAAHTWHWNDRFLIRYLKHVLS